MEQVFTIGGAFKEAYAIIKPKFWAVIGQYLLIFVALSLVFSMLLGNGAILGTVITTYLGSKWVLAYVNKGTFKFDDLFEHVTIKKFAYFILALVLVFLSVVGGFLLLIIPGIIFAVRLMFVKFIILEKEISPMEALRESKRITKGYRWKLFGFSLVCALVVFLGVLCLFVGVLFTAPLVALATAVVYKKLRDHSESAKAEETVVEEAPKDAVEVESTAV